MTETVNLEIYQSAFMKEVLRQVKARVLHGTVVAELQRDPGMAFDAGDGIDGDGSAHGGVLG